MNKVQIKKESRFSRKIIVGRINRHLPFMRPFINLVRFFTFRKYCPSYPDSQASYSDGPWIDRKVTKDQAAIEEYVFQKDLRGARILHVGIGSSSIAKKCGEIQKCSVDGITVMQAEKKHADDLNIKDYDVFILNKNDPKLLLALPGNYKYIIDNDIASYACCKAHFEEMLKTYLSMLSSGGEILTGKISIGYFDSGFPLPKFYLKSLFLKYGCAFTEKKGLIAITRNK